MFKGPYQLREKQLSLRRRSLRRQDKSSSCQGIYFEACVGFFKVRDSLDEENTCFGKSESLDCLFFFKLVKAPSGQSAPEPG